MTIEKISLFLLVLFHRAEREKIWIGLLDEQSLYFYLEDQRWEFGGDDWYILHQLTERLSPLTFFKLHFVLFDLFLF